MVKEMPATECEIKAFRGRRREKERERETGRISTLFLENLSFIPFCFSETTVSGKRSAS